MHSAQVCGASLCCQCVQRTCIVGVSSERLIICFLLSMCRASHNQASWSKLFYSSQLACIGPCALISFKFKFSKMRLETRATTENNFAPLLRPPARSLPPSFGTPRGGVDSSRVARFVPPPPCVVGKLNVCSGFPFSSASPYLHKGCFKIIKGPCGTRLPPPIIAG